MVTYKNPGESTFRVSERPVQKVVLVVPVEDQDGERLDAVEPLPEGHDPGVDAVGLLPGRDDTGTRADGPPLVRPGVDAVGLLPGREESANLWQPAEEAAIGQETRSGPLEGDPTRAASAAPEPAAVPPDLSNEVTPPSQVALDRSEPQDGLGMAGQLHSPRDRGRPRRYLDLNLY